MTRFLLGAAALSLVLGGQAAAETPVLTVYAYDSFVSDWGPGPAVEKAFEADCGCDLKFVAAGDGGVRAVVLAGKGPVFSAGADLSWMRAQGLDTNLMAEAAATGLFAPHGKQVRTDVPGGWSDPTFLPFDWGWFAFVYDSARLENAPDSFEALLNAPEDLEIVIEDPRTSTPGLGLLLWVKQVYGDRAGQVWRALAPRIVTVTKGWSEAYGMFLEGEADMVLSYTTSPAYHLIAENDPTKKAAAFAEGHYMQIEVAGKLAGATGCIPPSPPRPACRRGSRRS